jgi:hypothetical protein
MSVAYDYSQPSRWTREAETVLREYKSRGVSATLIALRIQRDFGIEFSRNAIIGKVHRLGLSSPKTDVRMPVGENRKHPRAPNPRRFRRFQIVDSADDLRPWAGPLNIPFLELGPDQCREIVGVGVALCCGQPQTAASSYCSHHHAINHWVRT